MLFFSIFPKLFEINTKFLGYRFLLFLSRSCFSHIFSFHILDGRTPMTMSQVVREGNISHRERDRTLSFFKRVGGQIFSSFIKLNLNKSYGLLMEYLEFWQFEKFVNWTNTACASFSFKLEENLSENRLDSWYNPDNFSIK